MIIKSLYIIKVIKSKSKIIFGIDEAGRGPLFGPVVACAIVCPTDLKMQIFGELGLKDSKQLSTKQREQAYEVLKDNSKVEWGIGRVSPKVIDKINILQATKLAMKRAVRNLENKLGKKAELLLIDGNFSIPVVCKQKSIIKGDETVFLIALASIVAKVIRDRAMLRYHKKYQCYGFDKHKGYGTVLHIKMLKKYGPCYLHRKTFAPLKFLVK